MNIKPIETDEELKLCAELLKESFGTVAETFGLTEENCSSNAAFTDFGKLKLCKAKGVRFFGVYNNSEIIGCIGLRAKSQKVYEISKLGVLPSKRNTGVGTFLIKQIFLETQKLGGEKITLGMIDSDTRLKEWYLKHGFKILNKKTFRNIPFVVSFLEKEI